MSEEYEEGKPEDFGLDGEDLQENPKSKGGGRFSKVFVINILLFSLGVITPVLDYFDITLKGRTPLNLPFGLTFYTLSSIAAGILIGILVSWSLSSPLKKYIENILIFSAYSSASFWAIFGYCTVRGGDIWGIEVLVFIVISLALLVGVLSAKILLRRLGKRFGSDAKE